MLEMSLTEDGWVLAHSKEATDILPLKDGQCRSKRRIIMGRRLNEKIRNIGEGILYS